MSVATNGGPTRSDRRGLRNRNRFQRDRLVVHCHEHATTRLRHSLPRTSSCWRQATNAMKMTNVGRRIAFDVEVRVQLRLPSLRHTGVTEIFDLMSFHIEDMPPKIPRQSTIRPISSEKLVTYFKQQRHELPPDLVARSDNSIELADILSTFSGSRLGITVSAVDAYSQRPIVTTHFFTAESIRAANFHRTAGPQAMSP